jgi:PAS domain S-box-containing protein
MQSFATPVDFGAPPITQFPRLSDPQRVDALRTAMLRDTLREPSYQRLARLAARVCHAPVALLAIVDRERVALKGASGLDVAANGEVAHPMLARLCRLVAEHGTTLAIDHAHDHPVSDGVPAGGQPVGGFLGVPLASARGYVLGCFAVADLESREWTDDDVSTLTELAASVMTEVDLVGELTDREEMEATLVESERRFREMLDNATDLVQNVSADGRVRYANRAWREALGYDIDEVAGLILDDVVAADQRAAFDAAVDFALTAGEAQGVETVLRHKSGRRVVLSGGMHRRHEIGGHPSVHGVFRDVTAQQTIRSERERLIATLEATTDIVAIMDVNGLVSWLNTAGRRLLGRTGLSDVVDVPLAALHPTWAYDRVMRQAIPQAAALGAWSGETAVRDSMGVEVPVSQVVIAHPSPRGGVWFLSTIMRDISDRKRVEDALRESESRFRRLSDASRDGIVVVDDRVVRETNRAVSRMFGIPEHEALGLPITALVAPDQRSALHEYIDAGLDGTFETIGLRRSGATFDLEVSIRPLTLTGRVARVLVLRDITGPKEVDRLKSEFVSTVSHELRTPLTSIRGSIGLVQGGTAGVIPDAAADLLRIALENTERLTRLVNDVLDLEKIEAGRLELHLAPLATREVIDTAVDALRPMMTAARVICETVVATDAPLIGDADRITQVLTNLLSNAAKFSPPGDVVCLRAGVGRGGTVRIEVEDHGPGIGAEDLGRLFRRFQQIGSVDTRRPGGTGLGLAISRSIVEQHKGRIGVESDPGVRTVFWFEIPSVGQGAG